MNHLSWSCKFLFCLDLDFLNYVEFVAWHSKNQRAITLASLRWFPFALLTHLLVLLSPFKKKRRRKKKIIALYGSVYYTFLNY